MTKTKYFNTKSEAVRFYNAMNHKYGRRLQGIAYTYDLKEKSYMVMWTWTSRA